jgi:hypothetical protein
MRNPLILTIPEREVHVLQALRRRTLEQIINRRIDYDALARAVHREATNLDAMLARDILDERRLADNLDELFTGVSVLVEVADVAGCHGTVERDGDGVLG